MAKGWEVAVRIQDNYLGWGSTVGASARPGNFLYVDSETLGKNTVIKERDAKIIPMRLAPIQTASIEQQSPGGEITFQPRSDDCINILFSFFQMATFMNGNVATAQNGTFVFTPVGKSLAWAGSAFATTAVYSVNVDKYFGEGLSGTGDGIRFERGIVSKLTLDQQPAADLIMTADLRFYQATDESVLGTGFKSQPNSVGSFSSNGQFIDWNGTISVQGTTYAIEKIRFELDNMITERRKLGQKGFYQFPFGRAVFSGEFDLELEDMSAFKEGTNGGTLSCRWQTSGADFLDVFAPNIYFRANDAKVSDTGPVMRTIPFRCYPTSFGGSNAIVLSVCPKFGTGAIPTQSKLLFP